MNLLVKYVLKIYQLVRMKVTMIVGTKITHVHKNVHSLLHLENVRKQNVVLAEPVIVVVIKMV